MNLIVILIIIFIFNYCDSRIISRMSKSQKNAYHLSELNRKNKYLITLNEISEIYCIEYKNKRFCDLLKNDTFSYYNLIYFDPYNCDSDNKRKIINFFCSMPLQKTDFLNYFNKDDMCYEIRENIIIESKKQKETLDIFFKYLLRILGVYIFITCGIPLLKYVFLGF